MSEHQVVDITIIGGGPVGLAAAYYAGHRDGSVRIVESLGQLGGQVAAVYPEKHVYDVAGHPKIQGQALVDLCVEQGLQFGADVHLGQEVKDLQRVGANGEEILVLTTHQGESFPTRVLIVTAGHGAFEPRKLEIDDIDSWEGKGLHYFVRRKEVFRDKTCVIVGGGDSALDWTLGLQDTANKPITLVHRRDRFRGAGDVGEGGARPRGAGQRPHLQPGGGARRSRRRLHPGRDAREHDDRRDLRGRVRRAHHAPRLPLPSRLDRRLGPRLSRQAADPRRALVDGDLLPSVYAAGDVAGYEGKITLISVGFGEAAIAANQAIAKIRGEKVQPKYSTD